MMHRRLSSIFLMVSAAVLAISQGSALAGESHGDWVTRALRLQGNLDLDAPLVDVLFPHTHNSYNARAYASGFRNIDPNQFESIADQLAMGIRSIELDVHYTVNMVGAPWKWGKKLLLCHGTDKHVGCHPRDRRFEEGLDEIKRFIDRADNRQEVIIVYIEDHMDGRYDQAANAVAKVLGKRVYRPSAPSCQGIPMDLTKRQILASGRNILIMGGREVCTSGAAWSSWAFAGVGDYVSGSYPTASIESYADGNCYATFSPDFYARHWVRVQEDRTVLSKIFGKPGPGFTLDDVRMLTRCRVNLVGLDKLMHQDARLAGYIWSWDEHQPSLDQNRRCALHHANGRLKNEACLDLNKFACKSDHGDWYLTTTAGPWLLGDKQCAEETQGAYRFAAPVNAFDNERLRQLKGSAGSWVKISNDDDKGWRAKTSRSQTIQSTGQTL